MFHITKKNTNEKEKTIKIS